MKDFEVKTATAEGTSTVAVAGELDIATAPVLEATLVDLARNGDEALRIDLANVRFMDSTGLRALLSARRRSQSTGQRLQLVNLPTDVERVLDVTGVRRLFDIVPSQG